MVKFLGKVTPTSYEIEIELLELPLDFGNNNNNNNRLLINGKYKIESMYNLKNQILHKILYKVGKENYIEYDKLFRENYEMLFSIDNRNEVLESYKINLSKDIKKLYLKIKKKQEISLANIKIESGKNKIFLGGSKKKEIPKNSRRYIEGNKKMKKIKKKIIKKK